MPLDKPGLKTAIVLLLTTLASNTDEGMDPADAINEFAEDLSTAIDAYVRTGTVTTTGSAAAQTGIIT